MRVVRWAIIGAVLVTFGAVGGFAISLLLPRRYALPTRQQRLVDPAIPTPLAP